MSDATKGHVTSEEESRRVAEESREKEWAGRTFLRELFLGNFLLPLVHPFPVEPRENPEFTKFYKDLEMFLRTEVDSIAIDETGEYPESVVRGLAKLGAFGIKIPKEYGGLGFSVSEYCRAMQLLGSYDSNVVALLSAHQSIGVPQPLKLFGTEAQKKKYLPRCASGTISAFALTEPHAGSDPASLSTTIERDGDMYILNGEKLWCTNGTIAELLVVMARHPETKKISAIVVEANTPGVKVEHRCRFMGLKALANGVISFRDVRVPRENLIGTEGQGLKIALVTLNTGRLSLPAACTGIAKRCIETLEGWCTERTQWGVPIWKHESVSHRVADMSATIFAMESIARLASSMADRGGYDIRLEAAAAKEWNTVRCWEIVDQTLQIRGGRGYETEKSLLARGEDPVPVERLMRDCRINLIFEGASEIMHLFMAREAVDKHLQVAGTFIDPKKSAGEKFAVVPKILAYYAQWYPPLWLRGFSAPFQYGDWGRLATHVRAVERSCRKLARESFHGMLVFQAKMERKQGFLFRCVDVVMELFAMTATLSRARQMLDAGHPEAERAIQLADLFCRSSRRKVKRLFHELWSNDDARKNALAASVMKGEQPLLTDGIVNLDFAYKAHALGAPRREESPIKTAVAGS
ncbi:MAG: acyl-CoA dehydrogenase family protein [Deltaproteobacteria bacterium]|nr:acyl-CoA dehydrogenase family protein [Deltaproteobacteria bacterium]MBI3388535.1 acyl-CoA dehydrogenase family protein [Deltaproteobacteria bacterium]